MVAGVVLFVTVCVVAVAGYMIAGWALDDAVYMVVITIFGVGYGEVEPVRSGALRLLTITVIIAGYGAVIYTVGGFIQMLVDGELNKALGARRLTKEIRAMERHTIICGFGRMGTKLAAELQAAGRPFVAIDSDPDALRTAEELGYSVIDGDASEEHVLEEAGIERAAFLATVLSDDATNVFITLTARALNPDVTIIARGEDRRTEGKLRNCGADEVVLPTAIGATKMSQLITRPSAEQMVEQLTAGDGAGLDLGPIGLRFDELRVEPGSPLAGRPLDAIEVRGNQGFLVVGVRRSDGTTVLNPPTDTVLDIGDAVIVLGYRDDIPQLASRFTATGRIVYRGVEMEV